MEMSFYVFQNPSGEEFQDMHELLSTVCRVQAMQILNEFMTLPNLCMFPAIFIFPWNPQEFDSFRSQVLQDDPLFLAVLGFPFSSQESLVVGTEGLVCLLGVGSSCCFLFYALLILQPPAFSSSDQQAFCFAGLWWGFSSYPLYSCNSVLLPLLWLLQTG